MENEKLDIENRIKKAEKAIAKTGRKITGVKSEIKSREKKASILRELEDKLNAVETAISTGKKDYIAKANKPSNKARIDKLRADERIQRAPLINERRKLQKQIAIHKPEVNGLTRLQNTLEDLESQKTTYESALSKLKTQKEKEETKEGGENEE